MKHLIKNKNIIIGVCGGIAAYKSVELLRLLKKQDANVRVIMTRNARAFVGSLTFEALSGQPVWTSLFEERNDAAIRHIDWAREADAVVIAPATANMIGKLAGGIADDALTTVMLAVTSPVLLCPSMNTHMYENRAVQRNLEILRRDGYYILEPGSGELACGTTGPGRLPEPEIILDRLISYLCPKDLKDKQVLVTAGPTQEPFDPVRFISNPSSGKMGFSVAKAAEQRGGKVTLITGPSHLSDPLNVTVIRVQTADEMAHSVFTHMEDAQIIIKTAAVSDFKPKKEVRHKIKKGDSAITIETQKTQDILKELGRKKKNQVLVGFAAETEKLEQNAAQKLVEKNLDMIAANLLGNPGSGFGEDTNKVTLIYKDGRKEVLPQMTKDEIAHILLDRILELGKSSRESGD
ncbi:MAG: bifunctional phosphopantothenoylcysteine decarboxylase/phosphopantothenate--cysteine ligase CoaBC [Deltaproteobacteria bacterium]|nr:MAG: bifunctional phosphopantothenoylcysteine decarboxylase/phosphopantothenate--cysteine ligase CoaBC [Deltaproteobacteria bacterium]